MKMRETNQIQNKSLKMECVLLIVNLTGNPIATEELERSSVAPNYY